MSSNVTHITEQPYSDDEIDLRDLVGTVLENKRIIVFFLLMALCGAYVYLWQAIPIYKADVLLQVEDKGSNIPGLELFEGINGGSAPISSTEMEILKSRKVLGQVVDNLDLTLAIEPVYFPKFGHAIANKNLSGATNDNQSLLVDPPSYVSWLPFDTSQYAWANERLSLSRFDVSKSLENATYKLVIADDSMYQLYDKNNERVIDGVVGEEITSNNEKITIKVSSFLARPGQSFIITRYSRLKAIESLKAQLEISESGKKTGMIRLTLKGADKKDISRKLDELSKTYLQLNISRTSEEASKSLDFLEKQIKSIKLEMEKSENTLREFKTSNRTADLSLETKAMIERVSALDTALQDILLKKTELNRKYTNNHPRLVALAEQERTLMAQKNKETSKAVKLPKQQQELLKLERDFKVKSSIYLDVLNKIQEFKIAKAGTVGNVYILDKPEAFDKIISPNAPRTMAIAGLLGLMLGVGVAFLGRALKNTIEDTKALETETNIPVYVTVPKTNNVRTTKRLTKKNKRQKKLLRLDFPNDPAIESLRSLRTSLRFALLESPNNILMISGASPAAGKSFVSSNFSAVAADAGQRILLIDADMRRGYLSELFGLENNFGLSDCIAGKSQWAEVVQSTEVNGLDVLTRGEVAPNPSELLMHENFASLLDETSKEYDLVIIDTPPIHAVTDPMIIGRHVGVVFLVVHFNENTFDEIKDAVKKLSNNGVSTKGFILNNVDFKANRYRYGHKYKHAYDNYYTYNRNAN